MKFIEFETLSGQENMQKDSDLLDFAVKANLKEPIFRLYGWSPACISLGRNQSDDFLDRDFLASQNIDVVRRLTGGRALLHDKEITYSYVCPVSSLENGESVINSYKEISQILIKGFERLGIELDFGDKRPNTRFDYCMSVSTGADLCYKDRKLIGSAQFRKKGYILQHGSILLDYDKNVIEKIFGQGVDESSIISLKSINKHLAHKDVQDALFGF